MTKTFQEPGPLCGDAKRRRDVFATGSAPDRAGRQ